MKLPWLKYKFLKDNTDIFELFHFLICMSSKQNENKPLPKNSSSKNLFKSVLYLHNKYQDTLQIINNTNASLL